MILLAVIAIIAAKQNEYVEIPYSSIRFRVISNSNNSLDIKNKIILKNELNNEFKNITKNLKSYDEFENVFNDEDKLNKLVKEKLSENNINSSYKINYGSNYFPEKTFKGVRYKSGNYNSLVVTLGEGKGENYWCVLYPPLCLTDENVNDYEYHFLIKDIISKYN